MSKFTRTGAHLSSSTFPKGLNRTIAALLALVLAFGTVPVAALAEQVGDEVEPVAIEQVAEEAAATDGEDAVVQDDEQAVVVEDEADSAVVEAEEANEAEETEEAKEAVEEVGDEEAVTDEETEEPNEAVVAEDDAPEAKEESDEPILTAQSTWSSLSFGSWTSWCYHTKNNANEHTLVVTKPGKVSITIQTEFVNTECNLYDDDSVVRFLVVSSVSNGASPTNPVTKSAGEWLMPGTYRLKVQSGSEGYYRLKATFEEAGTTERESNDSFAEAQSLAANTDVRGLISYNGKSQAKDLDFYKISVPKAGKIEVWTDSSGWATNWPVITLFDSDRMQVGNTGSVGYKVNVSPVTFSYDVTRAGTYYLRVCQTSVGCGCYTLNWRMGQTDLSNAQVTLPKSSYDYTGKAVNPAPTVKLNGGTLKNGTDYSVSYKNNVKPGTATVTITGKGSYKGSVSKTFKITVAKPTWSGATSMPVSSTAKYAVKNGTIKVKSGGSYVSVKGNTVTAKKAGSATLALYDKAGKQVATKTIKVYALSGNYVIRSAVNSSYVLDIRGKSKANSARMIVWQYNGGKNQKYQFVRQSDGTYGIKCVHSGKYVDVQGGGTKRSQPVIQYKWNGGTNQRWKITVDANNRLTFVSAKSGMAFDIQGGRVTKRAQMIQYTINGGNNQKWTLNRG